MCSTRSQDASRVAWADGGGLKVAGTPTGAGDPAKAMGRKGKPVKIGTGTANAKGAGRVTVKLRLTAAAEERLMKLKGTKLTLKVTHDGRTSTKATRLR